MSYAATAVVGGALVAERVHIAHNRPMVPGQPIHRVDQDDRISGLFSQQTDANRVKTVIPPADGSELNSNGGVEDGVQTDGGANFTVVSNRRHSRRQCMAMQRKKLSRLDCRYTNYLCSK